MVDKSKKSYLVGDFIFREGDQGNTAYVVESGVVELVKFTGEDYITLSDGEFYEYGEYSYECSDILRYD